MGLHHDKFEELREHKPVPGDVLESKDKTPVKVYVDTTKTSKSGDCQQVMFVNVQIDFECTGWYLTSKNLGLKALILSRSQEYLKSIYGDDFDSFLTDKIRVVRYNQAGTALICEVVA